MKKAFRRILINSLSIFLVASVAEGLSYTGELWGLVTAAVVLGILNSFLKPFLTILLLPINVITFGLLSWLANVIIIYILDILVTSIKIQAFTLNVLGTSIVFSPFFAYVFIAFALGLVISATEWLLN